MNGNDGLLQKAKNMFNSQPIEKRKEYIIYELEASIMQHRRNIIRMKKAYHRERKYTNELIKICDSELKKAIKDWEEVNGMGKM